MKLAVGALVLLHCTHSTYASLLDPSFQTGSGSDHFVEQVLPLPNGQMLICGRFNHFNGHPQPFLARLHENGSVDTSFNPRVNNWVRHISLQPDGRIIIVGPFEWIGSHRRVQVARLFPDGSVDPSFNPGAGVTEKLVPSDPNPPYVFWSDVQPDGKILITGSFSKFNNQTVNGIARLHPDGSLDTSFKSGSGLDSWGRFVSVLPDGKIMLTGWFTRYGGFSANRMVLLNPDGSPDSSFRPFFGDKTAIYCAVRLPDGKYIVSGHSKNDQGLFKRNLTRLHPNGSEDTSFLATTNERTESVLVLPDGKILACGWFTQANGVSRYNLARFNPDGSLDSSFSAHGDFFIWTVALDHKGRLLVSGGFNKIDGIPKAGLARLIPPGWRDTSSPAPPKILTSRLQQGRFQLSLQSELNRNYILEFRDQFQTGNWSSLPPVQGTGTQITLVDPNPSTPLRCYRVRVQ